MKPKLIILDWDGTVVDSFHDTMLAMNAALVATGHEPWDEATAKKHIGQPDDVLFPKIFGDKADEALAVYRQELSRLRAQNNVPTLLPGAEDVVRFLGSRQQRGDFHLAIVSNKPGDLLRKEVDRLGMKDCFNTVIGAGDAAKNKPDLAAFEKLMETYPADKTKPRPDEILVIGDSHTDMDFARNLNSKFICVGDRIDTHLLGEGEHATDMQQVLERMKRIYPEVVDRGRGKDGDGQA